MPFDRSNITAPFRMQPGLRRVPEGGGRLTPNRPGDAHLAAKLAVLSRHAEQALCVVDGWNQSAPLDALCLQAQRDAPEALRIDGDGGLTAPLLGWSVRGSTVLGDGPQPLGACLRALPAQWRRVGLLCLAFAEDFAVIDGRTAHIPWLAVCLPSHWAPRDKVGRHFTEVHAPVADNALLLQAAASLARLVSGPARWERDVWNLTPLPFLDAHPLRHAGATWRADATAEALAATAWLRTEYQTFIPVQDHDLAVFTIHVDRVPLTTVAAGPDGASVCRDLAAAVASMSPAVLAYRGLGDARERLLAWLNAQGGKPA